MEDVRRTHIITNDTYVKTSFLYRGLAIVLLLFIIPLESLLGNYIEDWGGSLVYEIQKCRTYGGDQFFKGVSWLGTSFMLLIIFPAIYNLYDTRRAIKTILIISFSMYVLSILSLIYQEPRPYWKTSSIRGVNCERGYGNPATETMLSSVLYTTLVVEFLHERKHLSKYVFYGGTLALLLLLGFSRLYLGENYPHQIIIGLFYGFIYVTLCFAFDKQILKLSIQSCFNWTKNRKNVFYWFAVTMFLLLGAVTVFDVITLSNNVSIDWKKNALKHCDTNYSVGGGASFYMSSWIFYNLGIISGNMHSSKTLPLFWWHTNWIKRWIRVAISSGLCVGIYFLFNLIPTYDTTTSYVWKCVIPGFLMSYIYTGILPSLFVKTKLGTNIAEEDEDEELMSIVQQDD